MPKLEKKKNLLIQPWTDSILLPILPAQHQVSAHIFSFPYIPIFLISDFPKQQTQQVLSISPLTLQHILLNAKYL